MSMSTGKTHLKGWFFPEPCLLCYATGIMFHVPVFQQYIYKWFSDQNGLPYYYNGKQSCGFPSNNTNGTGPDFDKIAMVQSTVARYETGYTMCTTLPALVVSLFIGTFSDRFGRKPLFIFSLTGACIQGGVVLIVMIFNLPPWVMLIGGLCHGLGGYVSAIIIGNLAYIADVTPPEKRAIRLAYIEGIVFLGGTVSSATSGIAIVKIGFLWSYTIVTGLYLAALLYVILLLPESLPPAARLKQDLQQTEIKAVNPILRIYRILKKSRPEKWKLKCVIPISLFMNLLTLGIGSTEMLYFLNTPLCLPATQVGYVIATQRVVIGVGGAIGVKGLSRILPDYCLMIFGYLSLNISLILMANAEKVWLLYIAAVSALASGYVVPLGKAVVSKTVNADEQGTIFAFVQSMEMLVTFLGVMTFNAVYSSLNMKYHHGAGVFYVASMISFFPFLFTLVYAVKSYRQPLKYELLPDYKDNSHSTNVESSSNGLVDGYGAVDNSSQDS